MLLLLVYGTAFWYGAAARIAAETHLHVETPSPDKRHGFASTKHASCTYSSGANQPIIRRQHRHITIIHDQKVYKSGMQSHANRTAEEFDYNRFASILLHELMAKLKGLLFEDDVAYELRVFHEQLQPKKASGATKPLPLISPDLFLRN